MSEEFKRAFETKEEFMKFYEEHKTEIDKLNTKQLNNNILNQVNKLVNDLKNEIKIFKMKIKIFKMKMNNYKLKLNQINQN